MRKRKWSVVDTVSRRYASSGGKLQWTTDLEAALVVAVLVPNGQVVDTLWFQTNFSTWRENGVIPVDALPPSPEMLASTPEVKS